MNIIGHRGAAGLELENTLEAIQAAIACDAKGVEFDIRCTRDNVLVVCHDADTARISDTVLNISESDYVALQGIRLYNGSIIPKLSEVLNLLKDEGRRIIIEIKDTGCAEILAPLLDSYQECDIRVASFKLGELQELKRVRPATKLYYAERFHVFEAINIARQNGLQGIDLNFWVMNPLAYWLLQWHRLEAMVYTVNNRWLVRFIHYLYPKVWICTNYPHMHSKSPKD